MEERDSAIAGQPPSGGCVLKPLNDTGALRQSMQPPSGGCVLKQTNIQPNPQHERQPPSGGCVLLKPAVVVGSNGAQSAAAFRRLCVETSAISGSKFSWNEQPPSGGCVLKPSVVVGSNGAQSQPPSGGCVLKPPPHG